MSDAIRVHHTKVLKTPRGSFEHLEETPEKNCNLASATPADCSWPLRGRPMLHSYFRETPR
jgi:hypothetical protein